jgi:hypothetical protein
VWGAGDHATRESDTFIRLGGRAGCVLQGRRPGRGANKNVHQVFRKQLPVAGLSRAEPRLNCLAVWKQLCPGMFVAQPLKLLIPHVVFQSLAHLYARTHAPTDAPHVKMSDGGMRQ